MGAVIGEILPLAVGIAVSPIPIIAAILMLLSPRARTTSVAFLVGWAGGVLVAVLVLALLAALIPTSGGDGSKPIVGTIKIVLGALLLLLAIRQWRSRQSATDPPALPKWMGAIDTMNAGRALLLGVLLSAVNPKNLIMSASAGVAIGSADLSIGADAVVIVLFVVIAALSVAGPVVAYLAASTRMAGPLGVLRDWLVRNNAAVMSVLLLVIGVVTIGKGIASL